MSAAVRPRPQSQASVDELRRQLAAREGDLARLGRQLDARARELEGAHACLLAARNAAALSAREAEQLSRQLSRATADRADANARLAQLAEHARRLEDARGGGGAAADLALQQQLREALADLREEHDRETA